MMYRFFSNFIFKKEKLRQIFFRVTLIIFYLCFNKLEASDFKEEAQEPQKATSFFNLSPDVWNNIWGRVNGKQIIRIALTTPKVLTYVQDYCQGFNFSEDPYNYDFSERLSPWDNRTRRPFPPLLLSFRGLKEFYKTKQKLHLTLEDLPHSTSLVTLVIQHQDSLAFTPLDFLADLTQLRVLDIANNGLMFPPSFSTLQSLEVLNLRGNGFIETRYIRDKGGIPSLQEEFNAKINNLDEFDFSFQASKNSPEQLARLQKKLKKFKREKIPRSKKIPRAIPESVFQLTSLQTLDVSSCDLTSIPPELANLKALTRLSFFRNKLASFPVEGVSGLISLKKIYFTDGKDAQRHLTFPPELDFLVPQLESVNLIEILPEDRTPEKLAELLIKEKKNKQAELEEESREYQMMHSLP